MTYCVCKQAYYRTGGNLPPATPELSHPNVANTLDDPDASSPRDASRRRGIAISASMQIIRAATTKPSGVMLGLSFDIFILFLSLFICCIYRAADLHI